MSRKKQIIVPIVILAAGVVSFIGFQSLKKPPEEKAPVDNTPIVAVETISVEPMVLEVESYGLVKPKYETELVAQISGQVVELSDTFVRGGFIKKDQLLARIDPNDYEAALIDAQANMASARAALETERAQGKVAEREWERISHSSPTELSLRKPQLAQEIARVKAAQASVLRAKRNLERTEIRAPYDAMIESRNVGLGSFVAIGSPIGKVLGTSIAEVRLPVADKQLKFLIDQGKDSQVLLNGTYAGEKMQWSAHIARGEGVVDNQSRMSYLVAQVDDPYRLQASENSVTPLRFGSYVTADILGQRLDQAAIIPRHLVVNNAVAILDSELKLKYMPIEIVRQDGANVIVSNGLAEGDQLIISALDYPIEGMQLALPSDDAIESDLESVETQLAATIED
ncbi:efflux RND transporter periplasmic adaptor subunit [Thalassotalea sp. PLHSN55]|uniref:efflux RND transporter periplasmic adaptor subunit n=1 Tax=Thalassotalea sp. PLHSN55 TaxID=3435888 RepID=UPI003F849607